jgi:hypothetical protein
MKKIFILLFILTGYRAQSQSTNDILNLLIANNTITQEEADSLRAEAAIKQQEADVNKKSFLVNAARQIQISGFTQLRYQIMDEAGRKDGFDIRKARLDIKGNITPFLAFRFMPEFADRPRILDAYAEIKIADYFMITAGQFKIPFSMENLAPDPKYEFIDMSLVVESLVARSKDVIGNQNGRDIGVRIGGTLIKSKNAPCLNTALECLTAQVLT